MCHATPEAAAQPPKTIEVHLGELNRRPLIRLPTVLEGLEEVDLLGLGFELGGPTRSSHGRDRSALLPKGWSIKPTLPKAWELHDHRELTRAVITQVGMELRFHLHNLAARIVLAVVHGGEDAGKHIVQLDDTELRMLAINAQAEVDRLRVQPTLEPLYQRRAQGLLESVGVLLNERRRYGFRGPSEIDGGFA